MNNIRTFIAKERIYVLIIIFVALFHIMIAILSGMIGGDDADALKGIDSQDKMLLPEERLKEVLESNPAIYFLILYCMLAFGFFFIAGIIIDIVYLIYIRGKENGILRIRPIGGNWGIWDVCKVIVIFLFAQIVVFIYDIGVMGSVPVLQYRATLRMVISAGIVDLIALAAILSFVMKNKRNDIAALGLTKSKFFVNMRYGALAYMGLIPLLATVMFLTMFIFEYFKIPVQPQQVLILLKEETHMPTFALMCLFTGLVGPVVEEIFFRGFAYTALRKKLGVFWAIVLSAAFFAYVHTNLASLMPIFTLGLVLAYMYEKTGSLVPSITIHIIHNSVSLSLLLFIKFLTN